MWTYLKALWLNENRFIGLVRGTAMAFGAGLSLEKIPLEAIGMDSGAGAVAGILLMGGSMALVSNPKGSPRKPASDDGA